MSNKSSTEQTDSNVSKTYSRESSIPSPGLILPLSLCPLNIFSTTNSSSGQKSSTDTLILKTQTEIYYAEKSRPECGDSSLASPSKTDSPIKEPFQPSTLNSSTLHKQKTLNDVTPMPSHTVHLPRGTSLQPNGERSLPTADPKHSQKYAPFDQIFKSAMRELYSAISEFSADVDPRTPNREFKCPSLDALCRILEKSFDQNSTGTPHMTTGGSASTRDKSSTDKSTQADGDSGERPRDGTIILPRLIFHVKKLMAIARQFQDTLAESQEGKRESKSHEILLRDLADFKGSLGTTIKSVLVAPRILENSVEDSGGISCEVEGLPPVATNDTSPSVYQNLVDQKEFLEEVLIDHVLTNQNDDPEEQECRTELKRANHIIESLKRQLERSLPLPLCQQLLEGYSELWRPPNGPTPQKSPKDPLDHGSEGSTVVRQLQERDDVTIADLKSRLAVERRSKERWKRVVESIQDKLDDAEAHPNLGKNTPDLGPKEFGDEPDQTADDQVISRLTRLEVELMAEKLKSARLGAELEDKGDYIEKLANLVCDSAGGGSRFTYKYLLPAIKALWTESLAINTTTQDGGTKEEMGQDVEKNSELSKYWHTKFRLAQREIQTLRKRWNIRNQIGDSDMFAYLQLENSHLRSQIMETKLLKKFIEPVLACPRLKNRDSMEATGLTASDKLSQVSRLDNQIQFLSAFRDVLCGQIGRTISHRANATGPRDDARSSTNEPLVPDNSPRIIKNVDYATALYKILELRDGELLELTKYLKVMTDTEANDESISRSEEISGTTNSPHRCLATETEALGEVSNSASDNNALSRGPTSGPVLESRDWLEPDFGRITAEATEPTRTTTSNIDGGPKSSLADHLGLAKNGEGVLAQLVEKFREREMRFRERIGQMQEEVEDLRNQASENDGIRRELARMEDKLSKKCSEIRELQLTISSMKFQHSGIVARLEATIKERDSVLAETECLVGSQIMKENGKLACHNQYLEKSLVVAKASASHCRSRESRARNEISALKAQLTARETTIMRLNSVVVAGRKKLQQFTSKLGHDHSNIGVYQSPTIRSTSHANIRGTAPSGQIKMAAPTSIGGPRCKAATNNHNRTDMHRYRVTVQRAEKPYVTDQQERPGLNPLFDSRWKTGTRQKDRPINFRKSDIARGSKYRSARSVSNLNSNRVGKTYEEEPVALKAVNARICRNISDLNNDIDDEKDSKHLSQNEQELRKAIFPHLTNLAESCKATKNLEGANAFDKLLPNDVPTLKSIVRELRDRLNCMASATLSNERLLKAGSNITEPGMVNESKKLNPEADDNMARDLVVTGIDRKDLDSEGHLEGGFGHDRAHSLPSDHYILQEQPLPTAVGEPSQHNFRLSHACQNLKREIASLRQELQSSRLDRGLDDVAAAAPCRNCIVCRRVSKHDSIPTKDVEPLGATMKPEARARGELKNSPPPNTGSSARVVFEGYESRINILERELWVKTSVLDDAKRALAEAAHREKCLQRECFALTTSTAKATIPDSRDPKKFEVELNFLRSENERLLSIIAAISPNTDGSSGDNHDTSHHPLPKLHPDPSVEGRLGFVVGIDRMADQLKNYDLVVSENIDLKLELISRRSAARSELPFAHSTNGTDVVGIREDLGPNLLGTGEPRFKSSLNTPLQNKIREQNHRTFHTET